MSEPSPTTKAYGQQFHDAAPSTVDESGNSPQASQPIDDLSSDSRRRPGYSSDQLQSPLRQLLLTMASHPPFEAGTDLMKLRELIAMDPSQINTQDDDTKLAPLHIAAEYGLVGAVVELLRADAKFEVQDREGRTPLMTATENKHAVVVEQLLKALSKYDSVRSPLEMLDNLGRTPLLWASIVDFPEGVELLIDAGADSNAGTLESKSTPLIAASSLGYQDIAELLLKGNPDGRAYPNLQDADGGTALHASLIGEHFKIVKLLLNAGADFRN